MILPIIFLMAGMAFGAPSALGDGLNQPVLTNPDSMSAYIDQYFADEPILAEIAWCESRNRQLDKNGDIFRGEVNKYDVGVMQINTLYHEEKAQALGMDLYSLSGNLAYAKYLYEKQGTKPWNSSRPCWGQYAVK